MKKSILVLIGVFVILAPALAQERIVSDISKIWDTFAKAKKEADDKFISRTKPIIDRYEALRSRDIERAADRAIRDLERAQEAALKAGDKEAAALAKSQIENVKDILQDRPKQISFEPLTLEFEGSRYAIIVKRCTWLEAKSFCEKAGGKLAVIDNMGEYGFIAKQSRPHVWIGAYRDNGGPWKWTNGVAVEKQMTKKEQEEKFKLIETGVCFFYHGGVHPAKIDDVLYGFICEWE